MIWNREIETMPRPELEALQLERLRWSIRWAYKRVPFHKQQFDAARVSPDDLHSLDDLRRFPLRPRRVGDDLATALYINAHIEIGAPGSIPRSEGKAVRVIDQRSS